MMKNKLFTRDFSLVVVGQIISILGSAVLRFALDLYVLDLTGRADIFALVIAISAIPGIIFSPIGGAIADRFNRRNLMVIFDFSSSAVVLTLLILLRLGSAPVAVIGVILAILSVISSMYQPTVQASVPVLVDGEQLASANGIVSGVGALSGLLGPVLGGVLYGVVGVNALVAASGIAFFCSAVMEIFIHIPFVKQKLNKNIIPTIVDDMKIGLRHVVKVNPQILKVIILAAALNLFMSPFFIIGVPYILRIVMRSSEGLYGIGMGIAELSTIAGALAVGAFSKKMKLAKLYRVLLLSALFLLPMAVAVMPFMLTLGYWPSFALFFLFGAAIMVLVTMVSIFVITSVQKETPNELMGKVMSIIMAVAQCAAPLGQVLYGMAFEHSVGRSFIPIFMACGFTVAIAFASKFMLRIPKPKEACSVSANGGPVYEKI